MNEQKKLFTAKLSKELVKRLKVYAASEESKLGEVVTEAIEQYLERNQK